MAVGVDYSLFYLKPRARGAARRPRRADAVEVASATSGRAVLGLRPHRHGRHGGHVPDRRQEFSASASATIDGRRRGHGRLADRAARDARRCSADRVDWGRIPLPFRRSGATSRAESRVWSCDPRPRRWPGRGDLGGRLWRRRCSALASPALRLRHHTTGLTTCPADLPGMQRSTSIQRRRSPTPEPADRGRPGRRLAAPAVRAAIADLDAAGARPRRRATEPISSRHQHRRRHRRRGRRSRWPATAPTGRPTRADRSATTSSRARSARCRASAPHVTGETASDDDFNRCWASAPLRVRVRAGLAFLLLLVTFRSLVIPLKAIVLNLLSVAPPTASSWSCSSTAGPRGCWASTRPAAIAAWLPLFLFVILFGLSMDYHVFILSRVKEARRPRHARPKTAVGAGDHSDRRRRDQRRDRDGRRVRDLRHPLDWSSFKEFGRRPGRRRS